MRVSPRCYLSLDQTIVAMKFAALAIDRERPGWSDDTLTRLALMRLENLECTLDSADEVIDFLAEYVRRLNNSCSGKPELRKAPASGKKEVLPS